MARLGVKPGAAEWKVQTNPLRYGGTPKNKYFSTYIKYPNHYK